MSEPSSGEVGYPTFPDSLIDIGLHANVYLPQTPTGIAVFVGAAAAEGLLAGDFSWQQFNASLFTGEQVQHSMDELTKAHNTYGIPRKPGKRARTDRRTNPHTRHFTADRMQDLLEGYRNAPITIAARYATTMLPELPSLPSYWQYGTTGAYGAVSRRAARTLFERNAGSGQFRPEAMALAAMWRITADSLKAKPAAIIARSWREGLRRFYQPETSSADRSATIILAGDLAAKLQPLAEDAIYAQLPAIAVQTGVNIPYRTVLDFLDYAITPAVAPTVTFRPRRPTQAKTNVTSS
jgi:hypothetical protein